MKLAAPPPAQGLYDPRHEHDACGVGFVVDLKGRKSHDIVQQGARSPVNLEHRGACGCEKNTGDGAGILCRCRTRFLRRRARRLGIKLPAAGRLRRRHGLPADRPRRAAPPASTCSSRSSARRGRRSSAGATVPTDNSMTRPDRAAGRAGHQPALHRPRPPTVADDDRLRAQALRHPPARRDTRSASSDMPRRRSFYVPSLSCKTHRLQGDAQLPTSCAAFFPDLRDDRRRVGAGAGPLALQHQHLPELGARAPLPLHRAQRRDQHAARQRQLDARAREHVRSRRCSATTSKKCMPVIDTSGSDSAMFDNVLELLVLAGPVAAARDDDDDPRAVGEPRVA